MDKAMRQYIQDPCGASSLSFRKTENIRIPEGMQILREDAFRAVGGAAHFSGCTDAVYFRMIHRLEDIPAAQLPEGFRLEAVTSRPELIGPDPGCTLPELAALIEESYGMERSFLPELCAYTKHPDFCPDLWIAVRDKRSGKIAAAGLAELDVRVGEGSLEWIQTGPAFRRQGLGKAVVVELLHRIKAQADADPNGLRPAFVTVSGKAEDPARPDALYRSCGFGGCVLWHVLRQ